MASGAIAFAIAENKRKEKEDGVPEGDATEEALDPGEEQGPAPNDELPVCWGAGLHGGRGGCGGLRARRRRGEEGGGRWRACGWAGAITPACAAVMHNARTRTHAHAYRSSRRITSATLLLGTMSAKKCWTLSLSFAGFYTHVYTHACNL